MSSHPNNTTASAPCSNSSSISTTMSLLRYGLGSKKSLYQIQSWITMITTLDGRDKFTKLVQYLSRFLVYYYSRRRLQQQREANMYRYNSHMMERYDGLKTSLSNSRRAFRLGRSFLELYKLYCLGLVSSLIGTSSTTKETSSSTELWKVICNSIKTIGLIGFWGGDNVSFLAQSGFLDTNHDTENRMNRRKQLQTKATLFANRSYFLNALFGLYINVRSYYEYMHQTIRPLEIELSQNQSQKQEQREPYSDTTSSENVDTKATSTTNTVDVYTKAKEQQFVLFMAIVKSICDVLIFSNNPGIDLWETYWHAKMHEGIHCICGMVSASTVMYTNLPNK